MPDIAFDCPQCLQALEAPESLAGEVIKCPACDQDIRIPKPAVWVQDAAVPAGKQAAAGTAPAAKKPQAAGGASAGIAAAPRAGKCPGCAAPLAPKAVICINCGYDLRTGRRLDTLTK